MRSEGMTEGEGEEERQVRSAVLLDPSEASREASEFCFTNITVSIHFVDCLGNKKSSITANLYAVITTQYYTISTQLTLEIRYYKFL